MLHTTLVILEFTVVPLIVPFILFLNKINERSRTPIPILYDEFSFELLATDSSLIIAFAIRVYADSSSYNGRAIDIMLLTFLMAIFYIVCCLIAKTFSTDKHKFRVKSSDSISGTATVTIPQKNITSFVRLVAFGHLLFALYLILITVFWYDHH
ncbi:hypothetical protein DR864_28445 (plasmid) [Runella rosea]|uniref:Uncharacterized protein n=1 Tax=Runella rosea TaxID=2259595 RepID=A0A344TT34_9BACT|nr:hypothetical protein [Runella rosea]AXE21805.1 hypothetical protein DR864_28445 [Runella rosea]